MSKTWTRRISSSRDWTAAVPSADDSLQADDDGDRVEGGDGGDTITGGDGSDLLYGGTGADTVTGGKGQDWIEGGEGDDRLYGGENADILWGEAGSDEIFGGTGDDTIEGHGGDDTLYGGENDDTLYGGAGADALDGGAGADTLFGDGGADTFVFAPGHGKDVIGDFSDGENLIDLTAFTGISGFDDLTVTADETGVTIDLTEHGGGTLLIEGQAIEDLDESDFVFAEEFNWIYGTEEPDRPLRGTEGNDWIEGLGGGDNLYGGEGNDHIAGGKGRDYIVGGEGDDTLEGGTGNDRIEGGTGHDTLEGGDEGDLLYGGEGDDRIDGGTGDDQLDGGIGNDTLTGGEGYDFFVKALGEGDDTITDYTDGQDLIDLSQFTSIAGFDDLTIISDAGGLTIDLSAHGGGTLRLEGVDAESLDSDNFLFVDDYVIGTDDDDVLTGSANNGDVYGKGGNDTITGGAGNDWLNGGEGSDRFVFEAGHGDDIIRDFTDGEDLIDLTKFSNIETFDDLTIFQRGESTFIDLSAHGGGTIELYSVNVNELDEADFILYEVADNGIDGI